MGDEMTVLKKTSLLIIISVLVLLLLASVMPAVSSNVVSGQSSATGSPEKIQLLFFHRTSRCPTCINAEQYARDTLDTYYPADLKSGVLSIQSIDYQKDTEMAKKYNVNMNDLKLVITKNGQETVKDLPEIWTYVNDRNAYMNYLKGVLEQELGR